jgi:hypothetical protein
MRNMIALQKALSDEEKLTCSTHGFRGGLMTFGFCEDGRPSLRSWAKCMKVLPALVPLFLYSETFCWINVFHRQGLLARTDPAA